MTAQNIEFERLWGEGMQASQTAAEEQYRRSDHGPVHDRKATMNVVSERKAP
jgi:hypothetical protein